TFASWNSCSARNNTSINSCRVSRTRSSGNLRNCPMLKLVFLMLIDLAAGLAIAAVVLAIVLPVMIHFGVIGFGDLAGLFVILSVMAVAILVMLLRPGSAFTRYMMRDV